MAKVKLYLDEDITDMLARVLRGRGFDVVSSHEVGMNGSNDESKLLYATQEERVLLSFNISDFANLAYQFYTNNKQHSGILVAAQFDLKTMIHLTTNFLNQVCQSQIKNRMDWLQNYK